jgi:hypothetical protein
MTYLTNAKKLEDYLRKHGWTPEKEFTLATVHALRGLPEDIQKHVVYKIVNKGMSLRQVEQEAQNIRSVLEFAENMPKAATKRMLRTVRGNLDDILDQGLAHFRNKKNSPRYTEDLPEIESDQ